MSLPYVILGLLQQRQRTGYDLKTECFDDCIAHLWQADQAQIYRTLDRLEAQGWVSCTVEIQHDRPNRKIYRITEAGDTELRQWLQSHQIPPIVREPLLVQLYFAAQIPNPAIIQLLEQELTVRQKKLAECEAVVIPAAENSTERQQQLHHLVLDLVTRREKTYVNWLQDAIATLQSQSQS